MALDGSRRSVCPIISLSVRKPSLAMISRSSCATNFMKFTTWSGLPMNFARNSGFCVATPTGQVSRWQTRIMIQPSVTTGGDRADTHFRDELHADAGVTIRVLQIVDQLRQIFDGINVMMRRRGNQADARRGEASLGDPGIHFFARQLAPLARLGALGHLDL